MKPKELKNLVVDALEDVKARNVVTLDVRKLTSMADYMIVATGTSNRHVKALAVNVQDELRKQDLRPIGVEGDTTCEWVLVDFGDIVVHVMLPEARAFYDLEGLWTDGAITAPAEG